MKVFLSVLLAMVMLCLFAVAQTPTAPGETTVKPGNSATNDDGVTVNNNTGSGGNAKLNPKVGDKKSATTASTKSGFEGSITGLDGNDTADIGANNNVTVSGEGGTINLSGGSTVTVTNTNTGSQTGNITVNQPSGNPITVLPGSTIIIIT